MNSINVFKGYDKVNPEQTQQHQAQIQYQKSTQPKSPIISTIIISATIGLTFVLGLMLISLITTTTTTTIESSPLLSNSSAAESIIRTICNVTLYPDTCFNSISSLNTSPKPNPQTILKLSLNVTISELTNISSFLTTLDSSDAAVRDCREQVKEALSQLNDSVEAVALSGGEMMEMEEEDKVVIKDIQTWVSSAVTDQETCVDGLEEMGSLSVEQVKLKMKRSSEFTSISLAIVANWKAILDKFF